MAGKTLDILRLLDPDNLGMAIAERWVEWNMLRDTWLQEKNEVREYVYATDTKHTSNSKLPWSNSTTIPKACQIRDNLFANYMATMFPKRRWLTWEGDTKADSTEEKKTAIKDYMMWVVNQPSFKEEISKAAYDFIDYGNVIVTPEWVDNSVQNGLQIKSGFAGPRAVRINPLEIVMNPIAASFAETPKILRSLTSIGEAKKILNKLVVTDEQREIAEQVFKTCMEARNRLASESGSIETQNLDRSFQVDGFSNFQDYLKSDYVELLTFCGDMYDKENNELLEAYMIVVIDRCKVILKKPYPYPLAEIPIFHAPWRRRQDNLWGMGPLDNLIGLQYRLDHVENMKADIFDLVTFPPVKIKGLVQEFEWGPLEQIFVDNDGDVELLSPDVNVLQANIELQRYESLMEEMAGSPKEAMGFRTPGEKTAYEVQRLENAASRIFQNKIALFEEQILEPLLNSMLVLAKQHLEPTTIRVISDDEYRVESFRTITKADISANGRLKPVAARHFAEKAEIVQNLNAFFMSPLGQDPSVNIHISGVKLAELMEELLNVEDYDLVMPYVRLSEQAEAQNLMNAQQEQIMTNIDTPAGLTPEDSSEAAPVGI